MTRETLEQRARRLGVAYTDSMGSDELETLCLVAESERPMTPFDEFVASIGGKLPTCYGEMWDGCGSAGCAGCDAERYCRRKFFSEFDALLQKAGVTRDTDVKEIAAALDIHQDSAVVAVRAAARPTSERKRPALKLIVEQAGKVAALTTAEIAAAAVDAALTPGVPSVVKLEEPIAEPEPSAGQTEDSVATVSKKKKIPGDKVAPRKRGGKKAPLPEKAPAKSAKAKGKAPTEKPSVKPAKGPDREPTQNGGSAMSPFDRERSRSSWVRALKPGTLLRKMTADGSLLQIKVQQGYYQDVNTGTMYATLYQVVCEKAGMVKFPVKDKDGVKTGKFREMPNYSVHRWFNRTARQARRDG